MKIPIGALLCLLAISCGQPSSSTAGDHRYTDSASASSTDPSAIPEERTIVKKEPVAQYSERTDNPLNEWYFSVALYETPRTFHYLMKLQFEEIRGDDTLRLPNLGIAPVPVIRKGPEKYSCIIGFMDKDNQFREYKKVYVKDDRLKVTALRHYAVSPAY